MVEDVGEVGVELQMDALRYHEVFPHAHVHVPVHLAAQNPGATTGASVDTQDRVSEAVVDRFRVLEHAWAKKRRAHIRVSLGGYGVVVPGTTTHTRTAHVDSVFEGGKAAAAAIGLAPRLPASRLV